jgi:phenylpropionate dioxygenase-like ring-hydroxylating dioxygenase large terminal subunit
MFVHNSRLRHILAPNHYFSTDHYQQELEHVLIPSWHFVATLNDLQRDGDYVTMTLFDRPLLLRRMEGKVQAYLNVCAHRHCLLTSKAKGHDPRFRCQYHGWEYQCDGRTARIPDASSFRPFERDNATLTTFRTATCGELVFVSLSDSGPPLDEQLGSCFPLVAESFSPPWRQVWRWQCDYSANWKIPLENGVESYHIPCLHTKTFRNYPAEPNLTHELHSTWTSFQTNEMARWARKGIERTTWWLGLPSTGLYRHYHVFPNLTFACTDTFRMAQIVVPLSATTSRTWVWVYAPFGPSRGIVARIYARINAWLVTEIARRVLAEDAPIFVDVQRGLEASPHQGVLGRREERIWVFQDHLARLCPALRDG